ncbi:DNA methyltransferase [Acidovorax sp. A1169]|uniref:DNA methyltransferase n=1 Tax=Acidovorax sp. A1169 TaxID=3059524 RepID=UPI0035206BC1
MVAKMTEIIREFGLSKSGMAESLTRALGVERVEVKGDRFTCVNDDCVRETARMEANSVGLVLTSIPFSTQYEYSPNYADFGHTDNNAHFFQQMDYLVPELLRVLKPGRLAAIHVKDRIVPGSMTGLGFQTVYPFHLDTIQCFRKHGFGYMGMKTIVTDVVRENNQTYRLGWSEQCKDGSKMGVGMPEYLLIFRKPPSSTEKSYADTPVVKDKPLSLDEDGNQVPFERNLQMVPGTGYSRARWQLDAHGFTRSSGDRPLTPEHLESLPHDAIFKLFKQYSLEQVYDFEHHVRVGEHLETKGMLPVTFMLLQPQSWSDEVWSDITRMLTLNGAQSAKGREMHLCPMQFDIADRAINQWSMPGEEVYDPFGGLMTVPYRAVKAGRRGRGCELSSRYFLDGVSYCEAMEREISMPSLFDTLDLQAA